MGRSGPVGADHHLAAGVGLVGPDALAHHQDGTGGVVRTFAHRSQAQAEEAAVAPGPDDEEVGALPRLDQGRDRVVAHGGDGDRRAVGHALGGEQGLQVGLGLLLGVAPSKASPCTRGWSK